MRNLDAWSLARLLAGHTVDRQLVSGPYRNLAAALDGLSAEQRIDLWDGWLESQEDRNAIVQVIAAVNPEGPAPEVSEDDPEAGDGWGPIRFGTLPAVEPFPLDVLLGPARDLAEAAARSIRCPVDFPAVATLAAASGSIGRSVRLLVKDGYHQSASLYLALVGSPSSGKSPSIRQALAPLWGIGRRLHEEWVPAHERWKAAPLDGRGQPPALGRIITSDPTTEALGPILAANPRGLTIAPDEMTKWVMSMDQYKGGKGGDRPFYLSSWGGEPIYVDRAKHMKEPIVVQEPFLTVVGGLTPDMMSSLPEGQGRDDGFMARLLICYPDRTRRTYSEEGIPEDVAADWRDAIEKLWRRPMGADPVSVRMTPEAKNAWGDWIRAHYAEQEADDFPASLEGPWGKLEAYAARLALILHMLALAADPSVPPDAIPPELPRAMIEGAARLVGYFKSHARRVHAAMGGKTGDGGDDARALLGWIIRNDLAEFSTRDIARNFDRFKDDQADLADALAWMTDRNLIRPKPKPETMDRPPKPGRKPSPRYEANPALWESPRFRQFRQNGPVAGSIGGIVGNAVPSEEESA